MYNFRTLSLLTTLRIPEAACHGSIDRFRNNLGKNRKSIHHWIAEIDPSIPQVIIRRVRRFRFNNINFFF